MKAKSQCISYCTRPDEASFHTACCTTQCLFEEADFVYDGKINAVNVKNVLSKALESNEKVVKKLDSIIQLCLSQGESEGF
jgi:hypothetical protein